MCSATIARRGFAWFRVWLVCLLLAAQAHGQIALTVGAGGQDDEQVAVESGAALPDSQPLDRLYLLLRGSATQQADLSVFLREVHEIGSASYHRWLSPAQFAQRFAPPPEQAELAREWLVSQGFQAGAVTPDGMRIGFSGTVAQVNRAFMTTVRSPSRFMADASLRAGSVQIRMPARLTSFASGLQAPELLPSADNEAFAALTSAVENRSVTAVLLPSGFANSAALNDLLQQAAAEGITVVLQGGDVSVSTLTLRSADSTQAAAAAGVMARPEWQIAPGLPADGMRAVPDAASADTTALVAALKQFSAAHGQLGELAPQLYRLRTGHGIFTHADSNVLEGTWSAKDGLGTIDIPALVKALSVGTQGVNVALAVSSNSITHGQMLSLTLAVTGSGATPTGTVTATLKGRSSGASLALGPLTLVNGNASTSTAMLAGDVYDISATYDGDSTYTGGTSNIQTTTVSPEAAAVTATVPPVAVPLGGFVPVTVMVSLPSGVGSPSGMVSVTLYGFTSARSVTATLSSSGTSTSTAVVNVPATSVGTFTFQANCVSTASFGCGTPASVAVTVGKGTPVVTLMPGATKTSTSGGNLYNVAVTVTPPTGSSGLASPTGSVAITDNGTAIANVTLAAGAGIAQLTLSGTAHSLAAAYAGDVNYLAADSSAQALTGALIPTTTTLTTSVFNGPYGIGIPLTATVTPTTYAAAGAPAGTITYTSTIQGVVGTASLANGFVTLNITTLIAGVHSITATYTPDNTTYAASTTTTGVSVTVTAVKQPTVTMLNGSPAIPLAGQNAALTASIALAPTATGGTTATSTFTGTVSFFSDKVYIGQGAVVNNAVVLPTKFAGDKTVSLTASYNGDNNYYGSTSSALVISPIRSAPTIALNLSSTTQNAGSSVTLTATLTSGGSAVAAVPSGSVSFYDNRNGVVTLLGAVPLGVTAASSSSLGTLLQNAVAAGAHGVTAVYGGDSTFLPVSSSEVALTLGDFTIDFAPASLR